MMKQHTARETLSEETLWQACLNKDASYDGKFIVAVRTTGIYCRPSCPARTPKRENVVFFRLPELAQQAGFRPCKRCRPDAHTIDDPQIKLARVVCRYIEQHSHEPLTLQSLSRQFNFSPSYLQRTFKAYVGVSPLEYTEACRINQLKHILRNGAPVTDAIYEAGFGSSSRVYEKAAPRLGMTPRRYQRNGADIRIQFTVATSTLGQLLVATTEQGVCAVKLGDDAGELERLLSAEFSAAHITRNDQAHQDWVQTILDFVAGNEPHLDLPLDVQATAFQKQVWQALQKIPYGQTRTYTEIAHKIGHPSAVRAVANACAANPTALLVPCHRVVRRDGDLGGYRWGIERKRKLLAQEAVSSLDSNGCVSNELRFR